MATALEQQFAIADRIANNFAPMQQAQAFENQLALGQVLDREKEQQKFRELAKENEYSLQNQKLAFENNKALADQARRDRALSEAAQTIGSLNLSPEEQQNALAQIGSAPDVRSIANLVANVNQQSLLRGATSDAQAALGLGGGVVDELQQKGPIVGNPEIGAPLSPFIQGQGAVLPEFMQGPAGIPQNNAEQVALDRALQQAIATGDRNAIAQVQNEIAFRNQKLEPQIQLQRQTQAADQQAQASIRGTNIESLLIEQGVDPSTASASEIGFAQQTLQNNRNLATYLNFDQQEKDVWAQATAVSPEAVASKASTLDPLGLEVLGIDSGDYEDFKEALSKAGSLDELEFFLRKNGNYEGTDRETFDAVVAAATIEAQPSAEIQKAMLRQLGEVREQKNKFLAENPEVASLLGRSQETTGPSVEDFVTKFKGLPADEIQAAITSATQQGRTDVAEALTKLLGGSTEGGKTPEAKAVANPIGSPSPFIPTITPVEDSTMLQRALANLVQGGGQAIDLADRTLLYAPNAIGAVMPGSTSLEGLTNFPAEGQGLLGTGLRDYNEGAFEVGQRARAAYDALRNR